ncbi:MAG: hypothetical protein JWN50_159 [Parcubacteria group bacterium]|nr:hypothetical protein [Parcubacteria group bacterium]
MKDFSSLLKRITEALGSDAHLKASVRDAVRECAGGNLRDEDILVKNGTLSLSASPALKNEIRLKEERILECIREKSGTVIIKIVYC